MKLKQRFIFIAIGVTTFLLLVMTTFSIFYYSELQPSNDFLPFGREEFSLKRAILETFKRKRVLKKKGKLRKSENVNETHYDSNNAKEIELSDKEYEELLENNELLQRPSKSPFGKPSAISQSRKDLLKEIYEKECLTSKTSRDADDTREEFEDLLQLLQEREMSTRLWETIARRTRITIQEVHRIEEMNLTNMEEFHLGISDLDLYAEDDAVVDKLLKDMAEMPIVHVEEKIGGTQLKLLINFEDGSQAMFKPMS